MKKYIGIDIHRKFSQVCVMDEQGQRLDEGRLGHEDEDRLREFFGQFESGTSVVMEATVGWMWLADLLQSLDLDVHLAHCSGVKLIAQSRLKTDKVDARTLVQLLRTGFLPEAYLAAPAVRDHRVLLRYRQGLVKMQTMVKNRIHGILIRWNIHPPQSDIFGVKGMEMLQGLRLPQPSHRVFQEWLKLLGYLRRQLRGIEQVLGQQLRDNPEADLLQSLPGVGRILSHVVMAEMGPVDRFPSERHLASYAGMVPSTHQSGERVRHGSTSAGCNTVLQSALVEAANVAVRRDSYFAKLYHQHKARKGHGKAILVVAHKMSRILWRMLKEQRPYRPETLTRHSPVGPSRPLAAAAAQ